MTIKRFAQRLLWFSALISCQVFAACESEPDLTHFYTNGWGEKENNRMLHNAEITKANVSTLKLKWAFGLGDSTDPHSWPLATVDTIFVGSEPGTLYALDRDSGCVRWQLDTGENIRTAIIHGHITINEQPVTALFFGTFGGNVYAVNAQTGETLWTVKSDPHQFAFVTGTPTFRDGTLYVSSSSYEVGAALAPIYQCCTFRGGVFAVDAATGKEIWRTYSIADAATVQGSRWFIFDKFGPSGAPVWSSPTVDAANGRLYFGSGENYSDPPSKGSDTIFALNLVDGTIIWQHQFTEGDAYNMSCDVPMLGANCPKANGPDLDFGAPPILTKSKSGQPLLIAGQKSGDVYALDPDTGDVIWKTRFGRGGKLGGVHWGMAVNEGLNRLFVPISDRNTGESNLEPSPGLHAVDLSTGELVWSVSGDPDCTAKENCLDGYSAAIVATPGLIFAGGLDGIIRIHDANSGEILWRYETVKTFEGVNGIPTSGGAIDVHGPYVAGNQLIVTSGYKSFGQMGGNALLVFELE